MTGNHKGTNIDRSSHYGALQKVVDSVFRDAEANMSAADRFLNPPTVARLDVILAAEAADLPDDLMQIVNLLPPATYTRDHLTNQLNSAINGHAWGQVYGTVI